MNGIKWGATMSATLDMVSNVGKSNLRPKPGQKTGTKEGQFVGLGDLIDATPEPTKDGKLSPQMNQTRLVN